MLTVVFIPIGDGTIVLRIGGKTSTARPLRTAALMMAVALLIL
jgi:hypothetical protein